MDTTQTFDEILWKLNEEFINEIKVISEDDIYWENGWNDVGIIIEEKIRRIMIVPFTDFLYGLAKEYGFQFRIKNEILYDEESITISIHIPNESVIEGGQMET